MTSSYLNREIMLILTRLTKKAQRDPFPRTLYFCDRIIKTASVAYFCNKHSKCRGFVMGNLGVWMYEGSLWQRPGSKNMLSEIWPKVKDVPDLWCLPFVTLGKG